MSFDADVRRLEDRFEILELLAGYCRCADLLDAQGMTEFFTDDCVVTYVPTGIAPAIEGKAALLEMLSCYLRK